MAVVSVGNFGHIVRTALQGAAQHIIRDEIEKAIKSASEEIRRRLIAATVNTTIDLERIMTQRGECLEVVIKFNDDTKETE